MVKDTGHYEHLVDYTEKMYAALGSALDTWGNVEAQLSAIFCAAISAKDDRVSAAAYSAIISFEVQMAITNAAVREAYQKDAAKLLVWKDLVKQANKLRPIRNKLAHGRTIIIQSAAHPGLHERRFLPFFQYYTYKDWRAFERLKIDDIKKMTKSFSELVSNLSTFGKSIGSKQVLRQTIWKD
jgi:hypothetical protein